MFETAILNEYFVGIVTVICGAIAIIMTLNARKLFTPGLFFQYVTYVGIAIALFVMAFAWHILSYALGFDKTIEGLSVYIEDVLFILGSIMFIFAANHASRMAEVYGFAKFKYFQSDSKEKEEINKASDKKISRKKKAK